MEIDFARWVMVFLAILSTMGVYVAVQRIFAPAQKSQGETLGELVRDKARETSSFAKLNPQGGFLDRLDILLAKNFGLEAKLENIHMLMGGPEKPNPLQMLHIKELAAVLVPAFLIYMSGSFFFVVAAPVAFLIPDLVYYGRIQRRQQELLGNFPTTVDLAALIIESGLDYMTAFDRIVKIAPVKTALEHELEKMLNEVQLGYTRRNALVRLAARTGLQEIRSFVGLIIQSDELGTSLVDLLRNFSADLRFRRLNRAEKMAAQASTKMLIPLFVFIFPTVFILMLAPMVMDLLHGGLPF